MVNPNIDDRLYLIGTTLSLVKELNRSDKTIASNNLTVLKNLLNKVSIEHFHLMGVDNKRDVSEGLERLSDRIKELNKDSNTYKETIKAISIFKSRISTGVSKLEIFLPQVDHGIPRDMLNHMLLFFPDRGYPELAKFVSRMLPERRGNIKAAMIMILKLLNSDKLKFSEIGIRKMNGIRHLMDISIKLKCPIKRFYIGGRHGKLHENVSYANVIEYLLNSEFGNKKDSLDRLILSINKDEMSIKKLCIKTMGELESFMKLVQTAQVSLTRLDLSHIRKISDKDLQIIVGKLQHLESLSISNSLITKKGVELISCLSGLKDLNLSRCSKVYGEDLGCLEKLTKLEKITMVGLCPLIFGPNEDLERPTVDFQFLSKLNSVKQLRIEHCSCVVNDVIVAIIQIRAIERLALVRLSDFPRNGIEKMAGLTQLKHLCLNRVNINNGDYKNLPAFINLESLDLSDTDVGQVGLEALSKLKRLRTLKLSYCQEVVGQLRNLKGLSGNLESLDLRGIEQAAVTDLQVILDCKFINLRYLRISSWDVKDGVFEYLKDIKTLEHLNIENCTRLTSRGLKRLLGLENLRVVEGFTCVKISEELLDKINRVRYDGL